MKNITLKVLIKAVNKNLALSVYNDVLKKVNKPHSHTVHIEETIKWLCRAQDKSGCDGVSASYKLTKGWDLAYPETTGYIISTFLRYAKLTNNDDYFNRAKRMGDWEIDIQLPSGAVRGDVVTNEHPAVFNTGMVILGWTDLYHHTGDSKYLDAASKAADWLCSVIEEDGKWVRFDYDEKPHAYCSRVAWSLMEVYGFTNDLKYKETAIKNIKWVLSGVHSNGWIDNMSFHGKEDPLTHTIAYTLRGLLESSSFIEGELKTNILDVVFQAAENIMYLYNENREYPHKNLHLLPGRINSEWGISSSYSCLTGNAQIAIIWLKLFQLSGNKRFYNAACEILEEQKKVHNIKSTNPGVRGAIAGSFPIWGGYGRFNYLNWAAKFFSDALMLANSISMSEILTKSDVSEYSQIN